MSITERIMKWRYKRIESDGCEPEFVPITRDELLEIKSDFVPMIPADPNRDRICGIEPFVTPFAEEMRVRQVELGCVPFVSECSVTEAEISRQLWDDELSLVQRRRLEMMVCADTTHIDVTLEWDIWARWKRWLRLTRWFPVRTRTVRIDGRVLYPYLKVSLPQNRHHVRFAIRP